MPNSWKLQHKAIQPWTSNVLYMYLFERNKILAETSENEYKYLLA